MTSLLTFADGKLLPVLGALSFALLLTCGTTAQATDKGHWLEAFNVVWNTPSKDSSGSMPLGNGDIGLNLWVEENGDLLFYISKTDAWSECVRLLKLGRVRIKLAPNPFAAGFPFRQELRLREGEISIRAGKPDREITLVILVDANHPVIRVDAESNGDFALQASVELWRTEERRIVGVEEDSSRGMFGRGGPIESADVILPPKDNRLIWFHRNSTSPWRDMMEDQSLSAAANRSRDPLLNLTFGCAMQGRGFYSINNTTLASCPQSRHQISIHPLTSQTESIDEWVSQLEQQIERVDSIPRETARVAQTRWWEDFWNRSRIVVSASGEKSKETAKVSQGYALQRFINACGGRGAFPIKFNGSIFTVDANVKDGNGNLHTLNADYRRWGGCYWFQNTRLIYWPMLASGDYDLIQPFFRMYSESLDTARLRTRRYFGHGGAFFPETMSFWGTYSPMDYGDHSKGQHPSYVANRYIKYYWMGGLELTAMMLDYYRHAQDGAFLREKLLPMATEIIEFYDRRHKRDENGKLLLEPAQVLETYHEPALNPLPDIAGLQWVLDGLLQLPKDCTSSWQREKWSKLRAELPPLPSAADENGGVYLRPADSFGHRSNVENPELYAIFPFRLYGVGKPNLDVARLTFEKREIKSAGCWYQDDVQAALLGLTREAVNRVIDRFGRKDPSSRFPTFWEAANDWIPDQDCGGNALMALQTMLLQAEGEKILLFPSWPKDWDVEFKLHAPMSTTVECIYRGGKVQQLKVTPKSRAGDVTVLAPQ